MAKVQIDLDSATPDQLLLLAATIGRTDLAVSALNSGANVNALVPDPDEPLKSLTALHASVQNNHVDVTRALLSVSADLQVKDSDGHNPLFYLPSPSQVTEIRNVFSADLCQKAARGDVNAVSHALAAGLDPNVSDSSEISNSPLHWAASFGAVDCVRALLDAGAFVDPTNQSGLTPLLDAALSGHANVVSVLLAANADVTVTDSSGRSLADLSLSPAVRQELVRANVLPNYPPTPTKQDIFDNSTNPHTKVSIQTHISYDSSSEAAGATSPVLPEWVSALWPPPQRLLLSGSTFTLPPVLTISAEHDGLQVARRFHRWLAELQPVLQTDSSLRVVGGGQGGLGEPIAFSAAIFLRIDRYALERADQAYTICVREFGIDVVASDDSGLFYACATLINLITLSGGSSNDSTAPLTIPTLTISDWPSIRNRGLLLNISRQRVPKLETLKQLVVLMAKQAKLNQLHLNVTDNFDRLKGVSLEAMFRHEDILELNEWCREHFVDLIPVIKSNRLPSPSRNEDDPSIQSGGTPHVGSRSLPDGYGDDEMLFDEYLPLFNSEQVNICNPIVKGNGLVDFAHLRELLRSLRCRGKKTLHVFGNHVMDMLADESVAHSILPELPARMVLNVEVEDEAQGAFRKGCFLLHQYGLPFYVSTDAYLKNSFAGRLSTFLEHTKEIVGEAIVHGAVGAIMKDSSMCENGAPLVFLYQSIIAFGGGVWNDKRGIRLVEEDTDGRLAQILEVCLFQNSVSEGMLGSICVTMGNIYNLAEDRSGQALQKLLSLNEGAQQSLKDLSVARLRKVVKQLDRVDSLLASYDGFADKAHVVELRMTAIFIVVAARLGSSLQSANNNDASLNSPRHGSVSGAQHKLDFQLLSDGRRSDLCNQLLQGIELMREGWMLRYNKVSFVEAVERICGRILRTLAEGMPYQGHLDELVGQLVF